MTTKPYSPFQEPDDIIEIYGGDKLRIAEAMRLGIVHPTPGTLAGIKIDRTRAAAAKEAAYKPSVAQQVMGGPPGQAPLAQAGGLGATAPAMPPMAPQGGVGMAAPGMAAPGMAAGGEFQPPYMSGGGLSEIPLPDTMFDENRDGGYAHGGIVAFPTGGEVIGPDESPEIIATAKIPPADPTAGLGKTYEEQMALIKKFAPRNTKYNDRLLAALETEMSPEAQKKRKKEDMWASLAELGFGIAASKSPTLFGAIGEAGARAAPAMAERGKERRAEQREAVKALAGREDVSNKQAMEAFGIAAELQKAYAGLLDGKAARALQEKLANADNATKLIASRIAAGATMAAANAPTGLERILARASRDTNFKTLIDELGIYGGKTSGSGTGTGWGTPEVVNP